MITRSITNPIKKRARNWKTTSPTPAILASACRKKAAKELFEFSQAFNQLAEAAEEKLVATLSTIAQQSGFFSDNPIPMIITDPF
ncbi:MAG: hypothetical protein R3C26_03520 [Calditrichia bacterium]